MMIKKQEKKLDVFSTEFSSNTGIVLEDIRISYVSRRDRFVACLLRAFIIFLCTFGATGLFITSLELPSYTFVLAAFCALISILISLLYYNKIVFNIGYIAFFFLFCFVALFLIEYANSGFNAILNITMEHVDEMLNLDGVRQYREDISNRQLSITACLALINGLGICFLNSSISGYRSPGLVCLQLLPIVQICMYFDSSLNYFYLFMMIGGFVLVLILQRSRRFNITFETRACNIRIKKNIIRYGSRGGFRGIRSSVKAGVLLSAVVFLIAGSLVFVTPYIFKSNYSSLKSSTDKYVEEFAINGIFSYFNQYSATGGVNGGRLGGVREVTMDFETDLIVTFVPYSLDTLYLRGYIGEMYSNNSWKQLLTTHNQLLSLPYRFSGFEELVNKESNALKTLFEYASEQSAKASMQIINVGANERYSYFPYYSAVSNTLYGYKDERDYFGDVVMKGFLRDRVYSFDYFPMFTDPREVDALWDEESYRDYVYEKYLDIPDNISGLLKDVCDRHVKSDDIESVISEIQTYFEENFTYSLSPGVTPNYRDFIEYFINRQHKGYCAHFATTGAMLLRAKGIPARYVEGYALNIMTLDDADIIDANIEDWYQGYNDLANAEDGELAVLRANVSDSSAHAWVEVYVDGFGWYPVEFTVAAQELTEESTGGFWDRFSQMLDDTLDGNNPIGNITAGIQKSVPTIVVTVIVLLVAFVLVLIVGVFVRKSRLYRQKSNDRLVQQYQNLTRILKKHRLVKKHNIYHHEMILFCMDSLGLPARDVKYYIQLVEEASYSQETLSEEQLEQANVMYRNMIVSCSEMLSKPVGLWLRWMN